MAEYVPSRCSELALSGLRIIVGFLFAPQGAQKLFGWFGGIGETGASASFGDLMWVTGVLELFGGSCIMLGVLTRPVAFLLSGQMAVAYVMAHASRGFWPLLNGGELAVLFCFIFLFFAAVGGGAYALEQLWQKQAR